MPFSLRTAGPSLPALAALSLVSAALAQSPAPPPPRITAGDTVNVEVKIVPFYAADAQGNPVYDLRPEEIELRVGGAPVPIESFDRYAIQSGRAGADRLAADADPLAHRLLPLRPDLLHAHRLQHGQAARLPDGAELAGRGPAVPDGARDRGRHPAEAGPGAARRARGRRSSSPPSTPSSRRPGAWSCRRIRKSTTVLPPREPGAASFRARGRPTRGPRSTTASRGPCATSTTASRGTSPARWGISPPSCGGSPVPSCW